MAATTATTAQDQRRQGRERRRKVASGAGEPTDSSPPDRSLSEITAAMELLPERLSQRSPGATALVGAAVGVFTGLLVGRKMRKRGNEITGDVAVHLLNKVELLTIRLQVRQARRGGPAEIDVHHVKADATSRP